MITEKSNFIKDCVDGKARVEDLDDYVSFWHENETGNELHDFLGFTENQYDEWVRDGYSVVEGYINEAVTAQEINQNLEGKDMAINIQNCIKNQKDLDFHPAFWDKPESEILAALEERVAESQARVRELETALKEGKTLDIHERGVLESSRTFLEIALSPEINQNQAGNVQADREEMIGKILETLKQDEPEDYGGQEGLKTIEENLRQKSDVELQAQLDEIKVVEFQGEPEDYGIKEASVGDSFLEYAEDTQAYFSIFQLKNIPENDNIRYQPSEELDRLGVEVNPENYDCVYREIMSAEYVETALNSDVLEDIFERFNGGFERGSEHEEVDTFGEGTRSMSVSDVVVLHANGRDTAHYCDREGFKELPENTSKAFYEQSEQHEIEEIQEFEMEE